MQKNLNDAVEALKLASECGGELDLPFYQKAYRGLLQLRSAILQLDQKMNAEGRAPTGDDYNTLFTMLRLDRAPTSHESAIPTTGSAVSNDQVVVFPGAGQRERYEQQLGKVISAAMASDSCMRDEAIFEGRIGLKEMSDSSLITLGVESWGIQP